MAIPGPQQRRLHALCSQYGFSDAERHDLALMVVGHEGSWSTLHELDAKRLADSLVAYASIQHLLRERHATIRADIRRRASALPPVARRLAG